MHKPALIETLSVEQRIERIQSVDLEPIMVKLMDAHEGEFWTLTQCQVAEKWYKRFLILNLKFPQSNIVPNRQIDLLWHYHILDTMKYEEDCHYAFGYFLHHFPYFGSRGAEDKENQVKAFEHTVMLFETEFHESLAELNQIFAISAAGMPVATCTGNNCGNSNCTSSCSSASHTIRPTIQVGGSSY